MAVALLAAIAFVAWWRHERPMVLPEGPEPASAAPWPDTRLDLNAATAAELTALPGIGPRLAAAVVEDRTRNGPYGRVDDLERVHRVGPVLVESVRPWVVVATETTGAETSAGR